MQGPDSPTTVGWRSLGASINFRIDDVGGPHSRDCRETRARNSDSRTESPDYETPASEVRASETTSILVFVFRILVGKNVRLVHCEEHEQRSQRTDWDVLLGDVDLVSSSRS
jgi:hypothetical protein